MTHEELQEIIKQHKHWWEEDCDGWEDMRANLYGADLRGANLYGADLRRANLYEADLRRANLYEANLRRANLYGANLYGADLYEADLYEANLYGADLYGADLREANLRGADLRRANLREANLRGADLRGADLDYSCLPLWCGSLEANFDSRQLKQIAYHLVKAGLQSSNATDADREELGKLIDYANEFHRADECGIIEEDK